MQRGCDHRLHPYRISGSSDIDYNAEAKIDVVEMGDYGDHDLEQGKEPSHGTTPLQANPLGPIDGGDKVLNIPARQNCKHDEDDELRGIQPESLLQSSRSKTKGRVKMKWNCFCQDRS